MQGTQAVGIVPAALVGGMVAGAIDISYAILASLPKAPPLRVMQAIASGLLGRAAFDGGATTGVLGLALHFAMNILMAVIFIAIARTIPAIRNNLVPAGLAYGCAVYFVMRWVVVPLSRCPADLRVINPLELAFHIVGVGLVIALAARHFGALDIPVARPAHIDSSPLKGR